MIRSMLQLQSVAAYLQRIGAEPRSLRTAVVKEIQGSYWRDVAKITINTKKGTIDAPPEYAPTQAEELALHADITTSEWPEYVKLGKSYELPDELKLVDPKNIYRIIDKDGKLAMIQWRIDSPMFEGGKRYVPFTFWSDGQWRKAEPEGLLPLYGMDKVEGHTTVFIHEGAKAAQSVQEMVEAKTPEDAERLKNHPWGRELQGAAHVGWLGGALNPSRTDFSELAKMGVKIAFIVADNDSPGRQAIPHIAKRLKGITTFSIEFTQNWPVSFDLADEFPKKMWYEDVDDGKRHYKGPAFRHCMHPATWATDLVANPTGQGKPTPQLRKEFAELMVWCEETDTYVCKEIPQINYHSQIFNGMVMPFSHVTNTSQLIQRHYDGRKNKLCYRPDTSDRVVTDRGTSAINLHVPTDIRAVEGDAGEWLAFLDYLFPLAEEREQVKRWCATLIARPDTRMLWGLLLVSEQQGMGKSTLGERILAPLVGMHNAGFPGERDMVESQFNGWVANKRLVVVGEIYTGHSFKAYNILKSYMTDKNIEVNEKFKRPYTIENWAHIVACSNSLKALRIEETDRRWFYPQVHDVPWPRERWDQFYKWLDGGGLTIIMHWAKTFEGEYVRRGEHAPMTEAKKKLIKESKGEILNHFVDILEGIGSEEVIALAINDVIEYMRGKFTGKVYETPLQFRKEALSEGWSVYEERMKFFGSNTEILLSPALKNKINSLKLAGVDRSNEVRGNLKKIMEIVNAEI